MLNLKMLPSSKVTWNMPVRNAMPYLPEALQSIEKQTFQDWEILAWDNGSTDGSVELLQEWIPKRIPGRLVVDRPLPLGECRAQMVRESSSEFIALMDADDRCAPSRLDQQIAFLKSHPQMAAVGSQIRAMDEVGKYIAVPAGLRLPCDFTGILHLMMQNTAIVHPTLLLRKSVVLQVGNYLHPDPVNSIAEDLDLLLRLAAHGELAALPEQLYDYRFHSGSTCQNPRNDAAYSASLDSIFAKGSGPLFGWSPTDALALRHLKTRIALPFLLQATRHIKARTGVPICKQLLMDSFQTSAGRLTRKSDLITRCCFALASSILRRLPPK
jgi:glycosyltransferase involved in cell wall biosynthesis